MSSILYLPTTYFTYVKYEMYYAIFGVRILMSDEAFLSVPEWVIDGRVILKDIMNSMLLEDRSL